MRRSRFFRWLYNFALVCRHIIIYSYLNVYLTLRASCFVILDLRRWGVGVGGLGLGLSAEAMGDRFSLSSVDRALFERC